MTILDRVRRLNDCVARRALGDGDDRPDRCAVTLEQDGVTLAVILLVDDPVPGRRGMFVRRRTITVQHRIQRRRERFLHRSDRRHPGQAIRGPVRQIEQQVGGRLVFRRVRRLTPGLENCGKSSSYN